MSDPDLQSKHALKIRLKELEQDYEIAKRGMTVRGIGGLVMALAFVGMMSTKVLSVFAGDGQPFFISGQNYILLALIIVIGLFLFYSLVLGRVARVRAEISKTKKSLEVVSGDKAK